MQFLCTMCTELYRLRIAKGVFKQTIEHKLKKKRQTDFMIVIQIKTQVGESHARTPSSAFTVAQWYLMSNNPVKCHHP